MPRRTRRHEEHTSHEAWAIPFGDLLTLLLAFFVVMYALSSVNEGKYRLLSDSLYAAFRGAPRTLEPVQVGEQTVGPGAEHRDGNLQQSARSLRPVSDSPGDTAAQVALPGTTGPDAALAKVADDVERALSDLINKNLVTVHRNDHWIEVEIRTDILFPSGSAQLSPGALSVLEQLAQVLAPLPNAVRVEGHTDNVPIRNAAFYSNWELSAARAGSVVRVLAAHGVEPTRLAVVGFGEHRPKDSNNSAQGRNANRRVIVVIPSVDAAHPDDPLRSLSPTYTPPPVTTKAAPGGPVTAPAVVAVQPAAAEVPSPPAGEPAPQASAVPAPAAN
jgi:chemotaxis protein MotB